MKYLDLQSAPQCSLSNYLPSGTAPSLPNQCGISFWSRHTQRCCPNINCFWLVILGSLIVWGKSPPRDSGIYSLHLGCKVFFFVGGKKNASVSFIMDFIPINSHLLGYYDRGLSNNKTLSLWIAGSGTSAASVDFGLHFVMPWNLRWFGACGSQGCQQGRTSLCPRGAAGRRGSDSSGSGPLYTIPLQWYLKFIRDDHKAIWPNKLWHTSRRVGRMSPCKFCLLFHPLPGREDSEEAGFAVLKRWQTW